jgi:hypothetical protein
LESLRQVIFHEIIISKCGGAITLLFLALGEGLIAGARSQLQKLGVMKPDPLMKEFSYTDTKAQLTQRYNNPIVQVQEYRRPLHQFGTSLTALHDVGHKLQNEMDRWGNENENWVRRMLPANVSYTLLIIIILIKIRLANKSV